MLRVSSWLAGHTKMPAHVLQGSSGLTMDEVAKQTKKGDVWDPGGELAILISAGKDATAEFDVEKYAPDTINGTLGAGDVDDDEEDDSAEGGCTIKR